MAPVMLDGNIIAVDTSETDHGKLIGKVMVAHSAEKGLLVSRLMTFDHTVALVSDQRRVRIRLVGLRIGLANCWQGVVVYWPDELIVFVSWAL